MAAAIAATAVTGTAAAGAAVRVAGAEHDALIRTTRLDSGLRLVTERMPDVRSVALGFWVDAGSRDEDPAISGASHFLEHLLFKGTDTRSAQQIAEDIDACGGEMNAFTTKEYTAFYVRVLDDSLPLAVDILSDIMWSPAFRPDEIEAERQVILEEILMHEDEPSDLVHDVFTAALYPGHALGREILGTEDTIEAMSRDDIAGYFGSHYRPESIVAAAAGNVDHDALASAIDARFAGTTGAGPIDRSGAFDAPRPVAVDTRSTEQAHVVVGARAFDRDDPDRYALSAVNQVLGGGMSSRLFQEIREKRGLAYSVYSYRSAYQGTGALSVYAGTAPGRLREVLDIVDTELAKLRADGVTARELDLAKGHLKGSLALGMEDSGARMSRIGRSLLVHGEVPTLDDVVERIDAVTLDDTARVVDRVFGDGDRTLAVVGPFDEAAFA
ncbi:MAG TPA: pitrilysin family protein [Acidimicrobiales bacterium]|nr:pitrilysin family protein [Acidimicrobiales bacterium]